MSTSLDPYLAIPGDPTRVLCSPPCSPVPNDWMLQKEDAPYLAPDDFDLDAKCGVVQLGNGHSVLLGTPPKPVENSVQNRLRYTRKGAYLSKTVPADRIWQYKTCPNPPLIVVDSYE